MSVKPRNLIVFDLEATCWERGTSPDRMEIIEVGAVRLGAPDYKLKDQFQSFVRPVREPVLSEFCMKLTSITQEDVDTSNSWPEVLARFHSWIGADFEAIGSWGEYDAKQIRVDCRRHAITLPGFLDRHVNLKVIFSRIFEVKPRGMKGALRMLGVSLAGSHHRSLDDAVNIAMIAREMISKDRSGPGDWLEVGAEP